MRRFGKEILGKWSAACPGEMDPYLIFYVSYLFCRHIQTAKRPDTMHSEMQQWCKIDNAKFKIGKHPQITKER